MANQPGTCGSEDEKEEKIENDGMENVENSKNKADKNFDRVDLNFELSEDEEAEKMENEKIVSADEEIPKCSEKKGEDKGPVVSTRVLRARLSYGKPITTPERRSANYSQIVTPTPEESVLLSHEEHEVSPVEKRNLRKRKGLAPSPICKSKCHKT
ncbi:hypothetical protein DPEC_G00257920 [Dallia pectoralis]|uniref:Uncharacterized protein n=1 Tax=Dallia pectoralis TaxID=75939 RepID=A0ACC2FRB8_DALPE|nr:hypothetical protein DPEC_G00257920 [Dallia pectoralis]